MNNHDLEPVGNVMAAEQEMQEYLARPVADILRGVKDQQERIRFALYLIDRMTGCGMKEIRDYFPAMPFDFDTIPAEVRAQIDVALTMEASAIERLVKRGEKMCVTLAEKMDLYYEALTNMEQLPPEELQRPITWTDFKKKVAVEVAKGPMLPKGEME